MKTRLVVAGEHRHLALGENRTVVEFVGCDMNCAARFGDTRLKSLGHGVPSLERWKQTWMGVEHSSWECLMEDGGRHRSKAGHRHEIDPVIHERLSQLNAVALTVKVLLEPTETTPVDQQRLNAGTLGDLQSATRSIRRDQGHVDSLADDGFENGARTRHQHTESNWGQRVTTP